MPTRSKRPDVLLDTSAAVAFVLADHEHHDLVFGALREKQLGLCGHAAFETFSVLTRLPPPARRTPAAVSHLLATNFPHTRYLSPEGAAALFQRFGTESIAGGSVYDALVGATAAEHRFPLASRDRRAVETYRALGVDVTFLSDR